MSQAQAVNVCPGPEASDWSRHEADDLELMRRTPFSSALEAACVHRLAESWGDVNWRYLRGRLASPSFALHQSERRWGTWYPARRLITISRRQVLCYTWESVVETLKHEIAHQWVSEALGEPDEPPHGPSFRRVCAQLACDPAASGGGGVSLVRGESGPATPEDSRLRRIHKLLNLADNNPDEHEAKAAFARASELMLRYNLDAVSGGGRDRPDYVARPVGQVSGRTPHYRYLIASILQESFFVQTIWVDSYDVRRGVRGYRLELMGSRQNVDMAHYVHDSLERQALALWEHYKREQGIKDRRAKRQYLAGLLTGFRRQLQQSAELCQERGLVWTGDPGLGAFARRRHPRTSRSSLGGVERGSVHEDGIAAGRQLKVRAPLSDGPPTGGVRGLLSG